MSCVETVCGVGGWTGPKPGDPDNNVNILARTVYGGINVSWSYPSTNAHAVAHSRLYRGINGEFSNAVEVAIVSGSTYFDSLNPTTATEYYYWVQLVSINGTIMDPVGPAMAIAQPRGQQTLESLTGLIDAGVLAQSLKGEIAKITLNYDELVGKIAERIAANEALSQALAAVQAGLAESIGLIHEEIITRQEGQEALASQLTTVAAVNQQNAAAILDERTARVTADSAFSQQISQVFAATNNNAAAIQQERTARTNADSALANQITTAQSTLNGNIASVQQTFQTNINTLNGVIEEIGALYTVKVDVNGLVGGFGIYNDGTLVEAGFDVDRFWVGRTGPDKVKPFIIDNGTVYLNKARIRNADIDTLMIAGNAVTVPSVATQVSTVTIASWTADEATPSVWYNVLTLGVNFGSEVSNAANLVGFSLSHTIDGGGFWVIRWRIVRVIDGVVIGEGDQSVSNNDIGNVTLTAVAFDGSAGNGFKQYQLQIANWGDITTARSVFGAKLFSIGTKR